MGSMNEVVARQVIAAKKAKRFGPAKPEHLTGRFQHFSSESERQKHLQYLAENAKKLPF